MTQTASNREAQSARAYLYSRHSKGLGIQPKKFAAASKELGVGFRELLRFIGQLYARGQQQSTFRQDQIRRMAGGAK